MGKNSWIGRKRAAIGMARAASSAEVRLIHYEMSGRYSLGAAMIPAFMLPRKEPATHGERDALLLPPTLPPTRRRETGAPDARAGRG
jgi:hypothetical protein